MIWNPDLDKLSVDAPKWSSSLYKPITYVQCESFDEFRRLQSRLDVFWSRQPQWIIGFINHGFCAECELPLSVDEEGDYLCEDCRLIFGVVPV